MEPPLVTSSSAAQPGPSCPPAEALARFIEGTLEASTTHTVLAHVDGCAACFGVVAAVLHDERRDTSDDRRAPIRFMARTVRWWVPLTAAAALVVAVIVAGRNGHAPSGGKLPPRDPGPSAQTVTDDPGRRLMAGATPGLATSLWRDRSASYGLAGGIPVVAASFRLGVHHLDIVVAAHIGDSQAAARALNDSLPLVAALPRRPDAEAAYRAALSAATAGRAPPQAGEHLRASLLGGGAEPEWLAAGEWVEAARLAAVTRQIAFWADGRAARHLGDAARVIPDPAARRYLAEAVMLAGETGQRSDEAWERLEAVLGQVILVLS